MTHSQNTIYHAVREHFIDAWVEDVGCIEELRAQNQLTDDDVTAFSARAYVQVFVVGGRNNPAILAAQDILESGLMQLFKHWGNRATLIKIGGYSQKSRVKTHKGFLKQNKEIYRGDFLRQ